MGAAGRRHVDPAFRAETMVRQIADVYAMLIKRYPERRARFDRRYAPTAAQATPALSDKISIEGGEEKLTL